MSCAQKRPVVRRWLVSGLWFLTYLARFFYADERHQDGKFKGMTLDGPAHGDFYAQLATQAEKVPWHATFVKDKGYVQFK